ncbi:MAG TPA: hypothetical protein VN788_03850, partial [Verrucomicrobiae bacterium]|nr:hypothetical protein [Verrucomicrobiae bacterium]
VVMFAYPREFRLRFQNEMLSTFSDLIHDEWERKGLSGIAHVWRSALAEVFSAAVPLRLQSPAVIAISVAILSSFALFAGLIGEVMHGFYGK